MLLSLSAALHAQYPLRLEEARLTSAQSKPFLYVAEFKPDLLHRMKREEADLYFRDVAARGSNSVVAALQVPGFAANAYGDWAFGMDGRNHADLTLPNPAFFKHLDWALKRALSNGLQLVVAPVGLSGEILTHNSDENVREYGRYLGRRYANTRNLMWLIAGEDAGSRTLVDGIQQFDLSHLTMSRMAHPAPAWLNLRLGSEGPTPFVLDETVREASKVWRGFIDGAAGYTSPDLVAPSSIASVLGKFAGVDSASLSSGNCFASGAAASLCNERLGTALAYVEPGQKPVLSRAFARAKQKWLTPQVLLLER